MLKRASGLVPAGVSVGFLADRGFADTTWMHYLSHEWHGHCRMRVNSNRWIHRAGKGWIPLNQSHLACGDMVLLQGVSLTKTHTLDNLHLALARDPLSRQVWMVVSDEPTTLQTLREYGERFQIKVCDYSRLFPCRLQRILNLHLPRKNKPKSS
jgi:hypothetical protein